MAFQGPWRRSRRRREGQSGPRPLGCLWPLFWLILLIVLLGLLFGGYRKGTKVGAPGFEPPRGTVSLAVGSAAAGGAARQGTEITANGHVGRRAQSWSSGSP